MVFTGFLVLLSAAPADWISAEERETENWLTDRKLDDRLLQPIDLTMSGRQLRDGLMSLAAQRQVAILLDRRVDPQQKIDITIRNLSLADAIEKIAQLAGASSTRVGSVIYVAPPRTTRKMRTLRLLRGREIDKLPRARQLELKKRHQLAWQQLATPREILAQVDATFDIEGTNLDTLPHDLWPRVSLPPLDLVDQLTLLTAGFDHSFQLDKQGRRWRLIPMPEKAVVKRSYPVPGDASQAMERYRELVPEAEIRRRRGRLEVRASLEDHERIMAADQSNGTSTREAAPETKSDIAQKRITLKLAGARLSALLESVEKQLGLTIRYDENLLAERNVSLEQRVSVEVENATVDEFFAAALQDTGLTFSRDGTTVRIAPESN